MDRLGQNERHLLTRVVKAMEPLGLEFKVLNDQARLLDLRANAAVGLRFGGRQLRYAAEIKHRLRPEGLGPVVHQLRGKPGHGLLVTDYVTPPLADALRAQGVEFIDAAGNAFLNQPPLLVFIKGQRPADPIPAPERGRTFQATGLQVLFALLARPELVTRPYREIAAAAGVAHGTVGWVMAELPAKGYVVDVRGRRRLANAERLLNQWVEAYGRTLRPRLLLGRFRGEMKDLKTRGQWPLDLLVGGEIAAARITRHLRPETATFYAEAVDPKVVLKLRLRAEETGNVEFRRRFWNFHGDDPQLTPRLLVYADLLAIGDARCLETAELLRGPLVDRLN